MIPERRERRSLSCSRKRKLSSRQGLKGNVNARARKYAVPGYTFYLRSMRTPVLNEHAARPASALNPLARVVCSSNVSIG